MKIETAITKITQEGETVHGVPLSELIRAGSFADAVFFILTARKPNESESTMFEAILTSVSAHTASVASAMNARISTSAKNPIHASLAAGLLGFGERHGMAVEPAMKFFYEHADATDITPLLQDMKAQKKYVAGYGHKFFIDKDPRAEVLFDIANETGVAGKYSAFARTVHTMLNALSSKPLPINADGAIAAILCDMGFDARLGNGVFIIGRVPGLIAHIVEEQMNDVGIRRLSEE